MFVWAKGVGGDIPLGGVTVRSDFRDKCMPRGAAYFQLLSSSGLCALYTVSFAVPVAELLAPVTGCDFGWEEGLKTGRRILTLRQAFNARKGLLPKGFKLPEMVRSPQSIGPAAKSKIDYDSLKNGYFTSMGWDLESGKPYTQTLIDLGLYELTTDLWE